MLLVGVKTYGDFAILAGQWLIKHCDHPHAIRILARAWIRILWRAWVSETMYDPKLHVAAAKLNPPLAA